MHATQSVLVLVFLQAYVSFDTSLHGGALLGSGCGLAIKKFLDTATHHNAWYRFCRDKNGYAYGVTVDNKQYIYGYGAFRGITYVGKQQKPKPGQKRWIAAVSDATHTTDSLTFAGADPAMCDCKEFIQSIDNDGFSQLVDTISDFSDNVGDTYISFHTGIKEWWNTMKGWFCRKR